MRWIFCWLLALWPLAAMGQSPIPNDPFLSVPPPASRPRPVEPRPEAAPPVPTTFCVPAVALPPPSARPSWAAARTILVFFEWNNASLSLRADQIVRQAFMEARNTSSALIEIVGHDDLSQTRASAQAISQRRANAVAEAMACLGWPRDRMRISARGATEPLVPTESGVREPRNRRVEIRLDHQAGAR